MLYVDFKYISNDPTISTQRQNGISRMSIKLIPFSKMMVAFIYECMKPPSCMMKSGNGMRFVYASEWDGCEFVCVNNKNTGTFH